MDERRDELPPSASNGADAGEGGALYGGWSPPALWSTASDAAPATAAQPAEPASAAAPLPPAPPPPRPAAGWDVPAGSASSHGDASWPAPAGPPAAPPASDPPMSASSKAKRLLGPLAALALVLVKFGAKLKAVLLLLPKLKLFTTSASMLVSIGAYALIWGWKFAVGFVLLLLVHELGHVFQLKREGIDAGAPMFIPFLGAVVAMKQLPDDAAAEARVGLAGPVLGSLACLVPVAIWQATGSELFQALAFVGFFLNLFNLLPVLPLDGGRAMAALSPWMWIAGYAGLVALTFVFPNPIMLLILLFGGLETWRRWKSRHTPEGRKYHRVSRRTRFAVAAVYIGLAALLAVGMDATFLERDFDDV